MNYSYLKSEQCRRHDAMRARRIYPSATPTIGEARVVQTQPAVKISRSREPAIA